MFPVKKYASTLMFATAACLAAATQAAAADNPVFADYEQIISSNKLTGLSVAIVDNYEIVHLKAVGLKEHGTDDRIDSDTAFSTASVSKAITGVIAAMLAEKGVIDLDAPVKNYLKRWQLPVSDFTRDTPITIRHLLTHTAGTSQSGFADFYPGDDIPTITESLNGIKLHRYENPIEIMWSPGSRFKYSGGGFVIAQVAIEDMTGKSLARLAKEMLFEPLGMKNSSMEQVGHPDFPKNVAKAHNLEKKLIGPGGVLINPQIAAGGLWSSAADMAKLVIDMQKALAGKPSIVISPWVAKTTTEIQTLHKAGGWGLGWARYRAEGNHGWFSHLGYNTGIGGLVMGSMEGGRAIIAFGNGVHRVRVPAIDAVVEDTVEILGWKQPLQASEEPVSQTIRGKITGGYVNLNTGYWSPFNGTVHISEKDGKLFLQNSIGRRAPRELIHVGNGKFKLDEFVASEIGVETKPDGTTYLTFTHPDTTHKSYPMWKLEEGDPLPFVAAAERNYDAALGIYQGWKDRFPKSNLLQARNLIAAGKYALEQGNSQAAANFFRICLEFHPDNESAKDLLASLSR